MHDEGMASDENEFWERRHAIDPSAGHGTGSGSDRRLVLLVDVTDPGVVAHYERVRSRLGEFACFRPTPVEALHLTIKMFDVGLGSFAAEESPDAEVRRIDAAVSEVVADYDPFEVEFARFNLFPDVVYAEADGGGSTADLNRRLCAHPSATTLDRDDEGFIPHLTLGYFTGGEEYGALVEFLERNRQSNFPPLSVDELALVAYDIGEEWSPTYETLETYDLEASYRRR